MRLANSCPGTTGVSGPIADSAKASPAGAPATPPTMAPIKPVMGAYGPPIAAPVRPPAVAPNIIGDVFMVLRATLYKYGFLR